MPAKRGVAEHCKPSKLPKPFLGSLHRWEDRGEEIRETFKKAAALSRRPRAAYESTVANYFL